jgi:peptidoglycan-associated lipoprotein
VSGADHGNSASNSGEAAKAIAPVLLAATSSTTPAAHNPEPVIVAVPRDPAILIAGLQSQLSDIFFGYDRSDLSDDAVAGIQRNAALLLPFLGDFPLAKIALEGHCDERGSAEYNLALGNLRAVAGAAALTRLGVPAENLEIVSYGKERPQCSDPVESCWARNRRVFMVVLQKLY